MNFVEVLSSFYESLNSLDWKIVLVMLLILLLHFLMMLLILLLHFCSSSSSSYPSSSSAAATTDSIVDDDNSSSASATKNFDVFISFRGIDIRHDFASHLYAALRVEKIATFIDDRLEKGGEIPSELLKAIENSTISIVIFSKNYASSGWCLKELEHILKCKKTILPVFYRVDPADVRRQRGSYAAALSKIQQYYTIDNVSAWKSALSEAANRSGFPSYQTRSEAKLVKEIVQDVLNKLKASWPSDLNLKGFFGLEERIKQIESLLCTDSKDVRTIGLGGMPGIGKTTLATFVFHQLKSKFEANCFMENVREVAEKKGQSYIQNELCSKLLNEKNLHTIAPFLEPFIANRLTKKKVLIVFDDVSNPRELEFLYGDMIQFGPGSRIIVTTRDKHVLRSIEGIENYTVPELSERDALQLFQFHAFKRNSLTTEDEELSKRVMKYADGNTLALTVLGAHLYGKDKDFWESTLNKLQEIPDKEIQKKLQISYDDLGDNVKNIFLDLASFFKGKSVHFAKHLVDGCGFFWDSGFKILVDKSLVTVNEYGLLMMHDLIQQMGREVVRQESPKSPERRTRLWKANEIYQVLQNDIGTGEIEGICFNLSELDHRLPLDLKPKSFSKMYNLRILKIYKSNKQDKMCEVNVPPNFEPLPDNLRYLHWKEFPFKILPLRFCGNLVALKLPNSQIEELPDESNISENMGCLYLPDNGGEKFMKSLLYLSFSGCSSLSKFPQLPRNITELDLSWTNIVTVPESIECLSNLKSFEINGCNRLENLPSNIWKLKLLEILSLYGCKNFKSLPEINETMEHLECLTLSDTAIKELPWQIQYLSKLRMLFLGRCKNLVSLPKSINRLGNLSELVLVECHNLKTLPEVASSIEQLFINNFILLPSCGCSQISRRLFWTESLHIDDGKTSFVRTKSRYGISNLHVCYPSNQFPEWMEGEMEGNSLHINTGCSFSNLLRLVVCAHVAVNHGSYPAPYYGFCWKMKCRTSNGSLTLTTTEHFYSFYTDHIICSNTDTGRLLEDDMCEIEVDFVITSSLGEISDVYQVKRCGFKCFYAEDLEKRKSITEFSSL